MKLREKKILHSILFFTNQTEDKKIDRLKLMKLMWLADRIHLNKYGRLILKETYNALPHGSVPSSALDLSRESLDGYYRIKKGSYVIRAEADFDSKYFSASDLEIMNYVWEKFGSNESLDLREFSHLFAEWKRFEKYINNESMPNSYREVINDFFDTPEGIEFPYTHEESVASMQKYNSHYAIQSFLND